MYDCVSLPACIEIQKSVNFSYLFYSNWFHNFVKFQKPSQSQHGKCYRHLLCKQCGKSGSFSQSQTPHQLINYVEDVGTLTDNSSRLNCPYSLCVPLPLVKIPHPLIIIVPDLIFVIVAGNSSRLGLWVVIPTSIDPDHLSIIVSSRI